MPLLAEYGVEPPTTWEELGEMAHTFRKRGIAAPTPLTALAAALAQLYWPDPDDGGGAVGRPAADHPNR